MAKLEGTFVVNVTPFDESDQVNVTALREAR